MSKRIPVLWVALCCAILGFFAGCQTCPGFARGLTLVENGRSAYVVVCAADSAADNFAAKELNEIVKATTGVEFPVVAASSEQAQAAPKRILIGRSALVRQALGGRRLDALREQESLVTRRGDDLILVGGDDWGTLYAVYDFVENEAGYRCYAPYPGGERFRKTDTLLFSGRETRQIPAFQGYRACYTAPMMEGSIPAFAKFSFRNRGTTIDWEAWGNVSYANHLGLKDPWKQHVPGHGFVFFVVPFDFAGADGRLPMKGDFSEHPEYFSLDKNGKRDPTLQLCLSNPELRKHLTERVLAQVRKHGPGIYMVGSNDHSNERYCWCPGCIALEKKYNSVGGPLWDYMLELCPIVKQECPGAYIKTLAYKGPKQTEKAPDGVVFPDNFICDAAFLNSCRTLKEIAPETLENGELFTKFENLKKWGRIAKHVSYWYYGGSAPYQIYERHQKELKELRDAGVESVGSCGLGSMEFGDITTYLYFRLLINPDLDAKALVNEFVEFKYGAAAPLMLGFIDELETMRRDDLGAGKKQLGCDDAYDAMTFIEAEQLKRWQKSFDVMLEKVKDDPLRSRNVRIARTAVDCWSIMLMHRLKAAFPGEPFDAPGMIARGLKSTAEAELAGMLGKRVVPPSRRVLNDMSLYANLKSDSVPDELKHYPRNKVIRHLPVLPEPWLVKTRSLTRDPGAVAQWAMKETVRDVAAAGFGYEFYDTVQKKWIVRGEIKKTDIVPGQYKLYRLFTAALSPGSLLVFGNLWDSSLSIGKMGRYYDPSYQKRQYEFWVNMKFEGPLFDPNSTGKDSAVSCDQVFLVNREE